MTVSFAEEEIASTRGAGLAMTTTTQGFMPDQRVGNDTASHFWGLSREGGGG